MKTIAIIRHGRKDGELIDKDQIAEIKKYGIPGLNELAKDHQGPIIFHLGSEFKRTKQTVKAFEKYLDSNIEYELGGYVFSDNRLGSTEMFNRFISNTAMKAEAEKTNWYNAALKTDNSEFIAEVQKGLLRAIKYAFESCPEDSLIICVCHTPLIEWLAFKLDPEEKISRDTKLKELTGFIITNDSGKIKVDSKLGF